MVEHTCIISKVISVDFHWNGDILINSVRRGFRSSHKSLNIVIAKIPVTEENISICTVQA